MIALVYTRVSTREQAEGGASLDMQADECLAWCAANGYTGRVYEDAGYSATSIDRPALQRLLADLPDADALVVWKVDRLSRNNLDRGLILRECQRQSVRFVAVTQPEVSGDSPEAELVQNVIGAVAQFESQMTGARVRAAMRRRAEGGAILSAAPYGYRDDWSIDPAAAEVVAWIDDRYLSGWGMGRIAKALNRRDVPSPTGGTWSPPSVSVILRRSVYSGLYRWAVRRPVPGTKNRRRNDPSEWVESEVDVPVIRDPDTFAQIEAELERRTQSIRGPAQYLFTGLLVCAHCGGPMIGRFHTRRKNRERVRSYVCANWNHRQTCPGGGTNRISEATVREALSDRVARIVSGEAVTPARRTVDDQARREAAAEIEDLDLRRRRILDGFSAGAIGLDEMESLTRQYRARREVLEQVVKTEGDPEPGTFPAEQVARLIARDGDLDALRRLARGVIERMVWDGSSLVVEWRLSS